MKKNAVLLIGSFLLNNYLFAQDLFSYLASFQQVALHGFADSAGNTKTPGRYNLIMQPVDGICRVWAGQRSSDDYGSVRYGYCLPDGCELVPPQFNKGEDFSDGLALVSIGDYLKGMKYGYINKAGAYQIPLSYSSAKSFSQGLAAVSVDGKQWQYIDKSGAVKIPGPFLDADNFSEGLACVSVPYDMGHGVKSFKKGYVDLSGKMVVEPEYIYGAQFRNGYAIVTVSGTAATGNRSYTAVIDREGKRITTQPFISIQPFYQGYWAVKIKGSYGFNSDKDEWGLVDTKGTLYAPRYPREPILREGLIAFEQDSLFGFMDVQGKVVIKPTYKRANGFVEGLAAVQNHEKLWGFINRKGEMVIKPTFMSTSYFNDGVAVVYLGKDAFDYNKQCGVIDKTGKLIIPFEKRNINTFRNGRAIAEENGISYYLYKTGKTSLACNAAAMFNARNGYLAISRNDVVNAMDLLSKPENKGCPISDYWLGYIYLQITPPIKDSIRGARLIEQAAKAGYPEAMYSIGYVYANGLSGKKDEALAKQWLTKACKAGVPSAYTLLGTLTEKTDPAEAAKLFQKAADLLEPIAMYNLALLYRDGKGVAKNDGQFNSWLDLSAKRQYQPAKDLQASILKKN